MTQESNKIENADNSSKTEKSSERADKLAETKVAADSTPKDREEFKNKDLADKRNEENLRKLSPKEAETLAARGARVIGDATKQQGGRLELYSSEVDGSQKPLIHGLNNEQVAALEQKQVAANMKADFPFDVNELQGEAKSTDVKQAIPKASDSGKHVPSNALAKGKDQHSYGEKSQYSVRAGDTIIDIAERHLSPNASPEEIARHSQEIMKVNLITDARQVQIGQSLTLPEVSPKHMSPADAVLAEVKKIESMDRNFADTPELAQARKQLLEDTKMFKTADERICFFQNMAKLEERANSLEFPIAQHELAKVYKDLSEILHSNDTKTSLSRAEKNQLVQHFMYNCGTPETITQGEHPTCNTTCMQQMVTCHQ